MNWTLEFRRSAEKEFRKLDRALQSRVRDRLRDLIQDPYSGQWLESAKSELKLRIGDWRLVYEIDKAARKIIVVAIDNRGEVYKVRRRQR